jgi:hypothetical protein
VTDANLVAIAVVYRNGLLAPVQGLCTFALGVVGVWVCLLQWVVVGLDHMVHFLVHAR